MTKDQRSEAQQIFEKTQGEYLAEMQGCFEALTGVQEKYPDYFSDCILYLSGKMEMEAEERAEPKEPGFFVMCLDGGNA